MPLEIKVSSRFDSYPGDALKALEMCGMLAEGYAVINATQQKIVDTGNLRNSITHEVVPEEMAAYVGTNVDYAIYNEMGTGKYIPGGSPPWVYVDAQGNFHRTEGMPARPFIKPAVADHEPEFIQIIGDILKL